MGLACVSLVNCKVETASPLSEQLEPFYGKYTGTSEPSESSGEIAERDLTVTIQPLEKNGFTEIYNLTGGYSQWQNKELEKYNDPEFSEMKIRDYLYQALFKVSVLL